jgi:hypothetical protein
MAVIEGIVKEVLNKTEWVAIVTSGEKSHLVGTWGDYIRELNIGGDRIVIPAGHYEKTEENLKTNNTVQLLIAAKDVKGSHGPGQGCIIEGEGKIETDGEIAEKVREKFEWARGALIINVKAATTQL